MLVRNIKTMTRACVTNMPFRIVRAGPVQTFHSDHYLRHNARRLEHLASLGIPVAGMSVLEVGAGIGDHSSYYIDRGCEITITEARAENIAQLRKRYPDCRVEFLDMESPIPLEGAPFDVVHCYGLLYHLSNPRDALAFLSRCARKMLLLETCVSFGDAEEIYPVRERRSDFTQAYSGTGCRPTRAWLFKGLQRHFEHVYVPTSQPCHHEFPVDWTAPEKHSAELSRSVFVASREPLTCEALSTTLLDRQSRQA